MTDTPLHRLNAAGITTRRLSLEDIAELDLQPGLYAVMRQTVDPYRLPFITILITEHGDDGCGFEPGAAIDRFGEELVVNCSLTPGVWWDATHLLGVQS